MRPPVALALALTLCSNLARSQTPSAEVLIHEGVELRRVGRDAEALESFRLAHERSPSSRSLAQMGFAEQALGRWLDAELHLQQSLDLGETLWVREHRALIDQALRDVATHLGALRVECDPPEAEMSVDHGPLRVFSREAMRLSAGVHHLRLQAPGRQTLQREVEVHGGESSTVSLTLTPEVVPDPPRAPERPRVLLAPLRSVVPRPVLRAPALQGERGGALRTLGWVATSTGAASVALGFIGLLWRNNLAEHWNSDRCIARGMTRIENCPSDRAEARTAQGLSVAGFAAGGALVITGVIFFLAAPRGPRALSRSGLGVEVSPGSFGLNFGFTL